MDFIDADAETVYLEEPEFWTRARYSEAFQREWRIYWWNPYSQAIEMGHSTRRSQCMANFSIKKSMILHEIFMNLKR